MKGKKAKECKMGFKVKDHYFKKAKKEKFLATSKIKQKLTLKTRGKLAAYFQQFQNF